MSRSSNRPQWLAAAIGACGVLLLNSGAQAQQQSPTAASIRALQDQSADAGKSKTSAPQPKDAAVSATVPRVGKRPILRCWQEGKLVYEGTGMTMPPTSPGSPIEMRSGNALALQIFDLKSGLCLLDHTGD